MPKRKEWPMSILDWVVLIDILEKTKDNYEASFWLHFYFTLKDKMND
jgi:hypothetical protein